MLSANYGSAVTEYFITLLLFSALGVKIAHKKLVPPTNVGATWLGVKFDTVKMIMTIPQSKMQNLVQLLEKCANQSSIKRSEYKSLLGKLLYVSQILPHTRLFLNRLLLALRHSENNVAVKDDVKDDLIWLSTNLPSMNCHCMIRENPYADSELVIQGDHNKVMVIFFGKTYDIDSSVRQGLMVLHLLFDLLQLHLSSISDRKILVKNCSYAHIRVIENGRTRNTEVLSISRDIASITMKHNITFDFLI